MSGGCCATEVDMGDGVVRLVRVYGRRGRKGEEGGEGQEGRMEGYMLHYWGSVRRDRIYMERDLKSSEKG